ncbi:MULTISPECIES: GNAT family N-acetyltransferase [unclassified Kitasatospora]|uniref:GNAT family N-acetyltransferase n=1 Tax=unclassified Kitasatospora TaxID=2633591 RepID=UPI00070FA6B2|nr:MULTISPECIES: GNAT family N-acetyltransferase [unclassified Kitasatospora]KQV14605.1 GCN5 family acetyltransferase [Kitasatospora sp. Root107]KRB72417.1 GCN5 family acetyltransferase [Kitasatospora sp. Root187]
MRRDASEPFVRPYRPSDRARLAEICVRTAHEGGDSSAIHPDPELMPTIFAYPYVQLEPELAFVLDDGAGTAVGYVLGTVDTAAFARRFRSEWIPSVAGRYPSPDGPASTPSEEMIGLLHTPERMVHAELAGYPAHLHIDLLPPWQGRGHGRALMRTLLDALHRRGTPAVHLCMVQANTAARAFYDRLGFSPLPVPDPGPVWYLGRTTTPLP